MASMPTNLEEILKSESKIAIDWTATYKITVLENCIIILF